MTAQDFLTAQLQSCGKYELTRTDQDLIANAGIEAYIYGKLTSKKFRKWAVDKDSESQIKRAIQVCVSERRPLEVRYPFGGYKLWSMPGSPEVDWAEFFSIAYYTQYLAPVVAAYEPGINFVFASDDVIIGRMDNVPAADTDAYFHSFQKLLTVFSKHLPSNLKISIERIGDLYDDKQAMEQELAKNVEHYKEEYATTVAADKKSAMLKTSALNIQWQGAKDLTSLSENEKQQVIDMGPVYHDAYCALSKRHEFNRGEDKILIFTTKVPLAIAIGTTRSTITKFWTGYGLLSVKDDSFTPRILSPSQLEALDDSQVEIEKSELVDLKNFKEIKIRK